MLEKLATVFVLILTAAVLGYNIHDRFLSAPARAKTERPEDTARQLIGTSFSHQEGFGKAGVATLVMVISTKCTFCTQSMPFYREVSSLQRHGSEYQTLAIVPQDKKEGETYLSQNGVAVDYVASKELRELRVPATPTLLLVDRDGRIQSVWVGRLDAGRQSEVLSKLRALSSDSLN